MRIRRLRFRVPGRPPRFAGRSPLASPPMLIGVPAFTAKGDAPCCRAARDVDGRLPIGFCGPDCIRRMERDARLHWNEDGGL